MKLFLRPAVFAVFLTALSVNAASSHNKKEMEAAARLQVFLDRADFGPGKIDGHYGDFTRKALALYRESQGQPAPKEQDAKSEGAPDTSGLDLASIDPVFITYTVTDEDLKSVGELPDSVPAQAKQKWLPYKTAAEAVGEKFHTDVDFLTELNPGKTKTIKAGDQLTVPNVEPFVLDSVGTLKPGAEVASKAVNDGDDDGAEEKNKSDDSAPLTTSVKIDTKTNMLAVYDGEKLIAAYPVTIGSAQTESPIGDWKVRGMERLPSFRYDKEMLEHGERSGDFHMLPPGPNNPVGVIWIALNKKGIGLHGTSDPDAIGRSASHGCVRLANWDVVRLAGKVKTGVPVSIH